MGVIIGARKTQIGDAAEKAALWAPNLWAHRRSMLWWQKMNAVDAETAKGFLAPMGRKSWHWVSSIPFGVASVLSETRPEIFQDRTGKALFEFLRTEEGRPYRVPGNKVVPV